MLKIMAKNEVCFFVSKFQLGIISVNNMVTT